MRVGAGIIIALMLLSGAAVFLASQSGNAGTDTPSPSSPDLQTFVAENVAGRVTLVLPSAIVGGTTLITDKSVLDEAVGSLPGVVSIESQFTKLDPSSSELTYLANVSLSGLDEKDAFVEGVRSLSVLDAPEVYFQASVSVPPALTGFDSSNNEKSFTLSQTIIQGIVSPQTEESHDVEGAVSVTFQGELIVSAYLIETQNVSLTPQPISITQGYSLSALQDRFSVAGTWTYIPSFDADAFQESLSSITGVVGVDPPIIPYVDTLLSLQFGDANSFVDDLNAYAEMHPLQFGSVSAYGDTLNVELGDIALEQAKMDLQTLIDSSASTNVAIVFQEPLTQFLVDVNVSSTGTSEALAGLESFFISQDMEVDIYQNGHILLDSIMDPDTNQSFAVPNGLIPVVVKPGHGAGDTVLLQISAVVQGGILTYINGVEMTPVDPFASDGPQV